MNKPILKKKIMVTLSYAFVVCSILIVFALSLFTFMYAESASMPYDILLSLVSFSILPLLLSRIIFYKDILQTKLSILEYLAGDN